MVLKCQLIDNLLNQDLIIGGNALHKPGIILIFKNKTTTWQEVSISMKPPECTSKDVFVIEESCLVKNVTKRIKQILDAE